MFAAIDEPKLARLLAECSPTLGAIVLAAIDTGMRRGEVLGLRWDQVDLKTRRVELGVQDTKTGRARVTWLTTRAVEAIRRVPRPITSRYVFANPQTGEPWDSTGIYDQFQAAIERAGIEGVDGEGVWLHDLRRSFVTQARRRGVPERVVMAMTGHRTRAVFDRYNVVDEGDVEPARDIIERAIQIELTQCAGQDLDNSAREPSATGAGRSA